MDPQNQLTKQSDQSPMPQTVPQEASVQETNNLQAHPLTPQAQAPYTPMPSVPIQPTPNIDITTTSKTKNKKILFIVLGIIASLIILAILATMLVFGATSKSNTAANEFVGAIVNKDLDQAYTYFSPELQQEQSLEEFKNGLSAAPFDSSCTLDVTAREASTSTTTGRTDKINGFIACNETKYPIELIFTDKSGNKKLLSYDIKPATN